MSPQALLEIAVAFHKAPARFPDLRNAARKFPGDGSAVLRLAAGADGATLGVAVPPVSAEELRDAAVFFVEQVFLASGADYYRLHGLDRNADDADIKEHHRLLMRLLHPDRPHTDREWQASAASRVNQAYTVLRDPERRRQYDLSLQESRASASRSAMAASTAAMPRRRHGPSSASSRRADTPFSRYLWRHLPQVVLGGVLLVAIGGVGSVWLSNRPSGALGSGDDGGKVVSAAQVAPLEPPVLAARPVEPQAPAIVAPEPAPPVQVALAPPTPAASTEVKETPKLQLPAPVPRPANLRPQPSFSWTSTKISDLPTAAPPVPTRATTAAAQVPVAETTPVRPRPVADPATVIPLFARLYERGDLDRFMELFDDNARNETGGKAKIRRDYEDLFAITANRQVIIWDMAWVPKDDVVRGEGRFQVRVQRKNESFLRMYEGTLRLDLVGSNDRYAIRGIYHTLDRGNN